jgi:hypothetical protein
VGQNVLGTISKVGEFMQQGLQDMIYNHPPYGLGVRNPAAAATLETALVGGPSLFTRGKPNTRTNLARRAQQRGYVIDPAATKPGSLSGVAEGFGGVQKTRRTASIRNQQVTDDFFRKRYNLAPDSPIDVEALATVRAEAGRAYSTLDTVGNISAGPKFFNDLKRLRNDFSSKNFKGQAKAASPLLDEIDNMGGISTFDTGEGIKQLRFLRNEADKAFRSGDNLLGNGWKRAADTLEQAIDDAVIRKVGPANAGIMDDYRSARQRIAETYSIQKALDGDSVSLPKLGNMRNNTPFAPEIDELARLGKEFEGIFRKIKTPSAAFSPLDLGFMTSSGGAGLAASALGGDPAVIAAALTPMLADASRPVLRGLALSPIGQGAAAAAPVARPAGLLGSIAAGATLGPVTEKDSVFNQQ